MNVPSRHVAKANWHYAALLCIAVAAAYVNSMSVPMLFDDVKCIEQKQLVHSLVPVSRFFQESRRPLLFLSLACNYATSGLDVWSYHITNTAIHLAATWLVFGLIYRLLLTKRVQASPELAQRIAFAVSLLWAVHPLQTESVTYIIQRSEAAMSLFYLLTLYCVVRSEESSHRWVWLVAGATAFYLGLGFKEVIVSAPVVVLLMDRAYLSESWIDVLRKRWILFSAWLPPILWLGWRVIETAKPMEGRPVGFAHKISPWEYLTTQAGVILHYLRLTVMPTSLCFDYSWRVAKTWDAYLLPGLIVLSALVAALLLFRRYPHVAMPILAFFLILAPTSSFFPISDLAFEHRMYLALLCPILLIVTGTNLALDRFTHVTRRQKWSLLIGAACVLTLLTFARNRVYQDKLRMWSDVVQKAPHNSRAHYNLGLELDRIGKQDEAIEQFELALVYRPRDPRACFNLGGIHFRRGDFQAAETYYLKTLKLNPIHAQANSNLATLYASQGRFELAEARYAAAIQRRPKDPRRHDNFGNYFARRGMYKRALEHYRRAVEKDPQYAAAFWHQGLVHYHLADAQSAIPLLRTALRLQPQRIDAERLLAHLLAASRDRAVRDGNKALSIAERVADPRRRPDVRDLSVLGEAYAELGNFSAAIEQVQLALEKATAAEKPTLIKFLRRQLRLYQRGEPYRIGNTKDEIL